ncbi:MAG TPA: CHAT domain-containing protein [Puia sp.]|nr:CHAT domain-containing protein [Puia sp.]
MNNTFFRFFLIASLLIGQTQKSFAQYDSLKKYIALFPSEESYWNKYGNSGKYDSVFYYAQKMDSLSNAKFGDSSTEHAVFLCHYLGFTYSIIGDQISAYKCFQKGIAIFKRNNSIYNDIYREALFYFGITCFSIGDLRGAEIYLPAASKIYKEKEDIGRYAQSMLCVAAVLAAKGEYANAEIIDLDIKKTLDSLAHPKLIGYIHYLLASVNNNLGQIYIETGDLQKGIIFIQRAVDLDALSIKEGYTNSDYFSIILNLTETYILNNQLDSASAKCKTVEAELAKKPDILLTAKVLSKKAFIQQQQKNLSEAIRLIKQYWKMSDSLAQKPDDYDDVLTNLGKLYTDTKKYLSADSLLKEETRKLYTSGLTYSYAMQQSFSYLCANLIAMKKYDEAEDSLLSLAKLSFETMNKNFTGMSEAEKLKYKKGVDQIFEMMYACLTNDKTITRSRIENIYRFELMKKGIVLYSQANLLNKIKSTNDPDLTLLYNQWLTNRQMIGRQYSLPYADRFMNVDSMEDVTENIEKKIFSDLSVATDSNTKIPSVYSNKNTASIEFIKYTNTLSSFQKNETFYAAFVTTSGDSIIHFTQLCSEKLLRNAMNINKSESLTNSQYFQKLYDNKSKSSSELYKLLWQPIEPYLKNAKIINYSTAGILNNIAFHSLHNGKEYLMNKCSFHRFSTLLNSGNKNESFTIKDSLSIWGNMNYGESALSGRAPFIDGIKKKNGKNKQAAKPNLKEQMKQPKDIFREPVQEFLGNELDEIKKMLSEKKIGFDDYEKSLATEENFKTTASKIKGILHISTHGFYTPKNIRKGKGVLPADFIGGSENPLLRCGLAFSGVNYYLTKGVPYKNREDQILFGYEVAQLDLRNVSLVILSACETGLGDVSDDEGNFGLQRAFTMAGANKTLVSLWQVPATQTTELFNLFYSNMLQGQSFSESLGNAQKKMQQKYPPYYWAGFVLIE